MTHNDLIEVRQTEDFKTWFAGLRDLRATKRIAQRIARIQYGLFGDAKFFEEIGELRIDEGPGYRIYFVQRGKIVVILLCGGDKSSQGRDINKARKMAKDYR